MWRRGMHVKYRWVSQRERDYYEEKGVAGWIILTLISERWDQVVWTGLIWLRTETSGRFL
jgi:hypothetical protein